MTERNQTIGNAKIQKKHLSVEKKIRTPAKKHPWGILDEKSFFLQFDYFV